MFAIFALASLHAATPALLPAATATATSRTAAPTVATGDGAARGLRTGGVLTYRGLPYAAPPVGPLRWRPPAPVAGWRGIRPARRFGPSCPQDDPMGGFAAPSANEDCLYLNVVTPAVRPRRAMPVLVWIHGGALRGGSGSDYDTRALARQGIVVVTINYRLGVLGFYANPALGADNAAPNYAILDQIAALHWVRRTIAAFGGDPGNVTIAGESAGARSVQVLLSSPLASGLFRRAILQSISTDNTIPRAVAQERGRAVAVAAGCGADDADCLRALPVAALLKAQAGPSTVPIAGGPDLPEAPGVAISAGRFHRVPIVFGWNRDEATWQTALIALRRRQPIDAADYRAALATYAGTGDRLRTVSAAYPLAAFPTAGAAVARIRTDAAFVCPTLRMLRAMARFVPTYGYEFAAHGVPMYMPPAGFDYGTAHTSELQFLFPAFHGATGTRRALTAPQRALARSMRRMWAGFIATGRPATLGTVWRAFAPPAYGIMVLRGPRSAMMPASYYADRRCDLWERPVPWDNNGPR